jgi:hypothetical protein
MNQISTYSQYKGTRENIIAINKITDQNLVSMTISSFTDRYIVKTYIENRLIILQSTTLLKESRERSYYS